MIGLDTNVLVRYIVQDDPNQAAAAGRLIEGRCTAQAPGYVSVLVLVELVWLLTSANSPSPAVPLRRSARYVLQVPARTRWGLDGVAACGSLGEVVRTAAPPGAIPR